MSRCTNSNRLGGLALAAVLVAALGLPAAGVVIPGDPADGRIITNTVTTTGPEIGVGHYDDTNTASTVGSTAIFFFELPDPAAVGTVNNAAFLYSLNDKSGSFTTNPANADLWGLGYVAVPTIDTNWFLAGDTDSSLGVNLGANQVVKIADDIMSPNTFDPGSPFSRLAVPDPALTDFLNLLYDQGAVSGDYAILRMNIDVPTSTLNRRYDVATADDLDAAARPELRMNENITLLYDPFDDGDRLDGADPRDTDWWKVTGDLNLTVADDSAGIGSGNALEVVMDATKRRFVGGFPAVTLAEPGDFIQLTMTFRPTVVVFGVDEGFRLGLMNSGGNPVEADTTSVGSVGYFTGYMIRMSTGAFGDLSLVQLPDPGEFFLGGSTDFLSRDPGAIPVNPPDPYTLIYTLTRSSATQMTTRVVLNDVVLIGDDPGTDPDVGDWPFEDTFDAIGMGNNPDDGTDFFADNIRVETSVSLFTVVPHTDVVVDVIELMFETQPGIRYGLEDATDVVSSNWVDSAYTVTGDGGELLVYDPDAVEANKSYRLVDGP